MIYRGNFDPDEIISAICESLTSPPKYCSDKSEAAAEGESANSHTGIIVVVVVLSVLVMAVIGICAYRQFISRELTNDMTSRVGELVAHYANRVSKSKSKQKKKLVEPFDEEI